MRHVRHPDRARAVASTPAAPFALVVLLAGCGWVDSTGRQPGDGPPAVQVVLADVAPGEPIPLNEREPARFEVTRAALAGDEYAWTETPLEEGALDGCAGVPGFRPELAAATFVEACTDESACAFDFERVPASGEGESVAFDVVVPELRASIGLRHELTVTTADGATGTSAYDFCLVAINEAPDALDDGPYVVAEGTTLVVGPDDDDNLLANDTDDDDAGNDGLRVVTTPVSPPSPSSTLELREDGGFSYSFPDSGLLGSIADSFDYVVTDGLGTSPPATVRLTIVPRDLPPRLDVPLEPLEARVGEFFEADLAAGFSDPEGDELTFSPIGDPLPESGSLTLDAAGLLSGEPLAADVGDYDIRLVASDGVRETEGRVTLSIVEPPNAAPAYVAGTVGNIVLRRFFLMDPVTVEFVDPDGDPLDYELIGDLPRGVRFDPDTGTLSGRPTLRGDFTGLQILARDPDGAEGSSIVFTIQVI